LTTSTKKIEIILRYNFKGWDEDGLPWWTATNGEYRLSYQDFLLEVEDLLNRFFVRMDRQVKGVVAYFTKEVAVLLGSLCDEINQTKEKLGEELGVRYNSE